MLDLLQMRSIATFVKTPQAVPCRLDKLPRVTQPMFCKSKHIVEHLELSQYYNNIKHPNIIIFLPGFSQRQFESFVCIARK